MTLHESSDPDEFPFNSVHGHHPELGEAKEEIPAAMIEVAENTNLAMQQNILLSVETELRKLMKTKRCLKHEIGKGSRRQH